MSELPFPNEDQQPPESRQKGQRREVPKIGKKKKPDSEQHAEAPTFLGGQREVSSFPQKKGTAQKESSHFPPSKSFPLAEGRQKMSSFPQEKGTAQKESSHFLPSKSFPVAEGRQKMSSFPQEKGKDTVQKEYPPQPPKSYSVQKEEQKTTPTLPLRSLLPNLKARTRDFGHIVAMQEPEFMDISTRDIQFKDLSPNTFKDDLRSHGIRIIERDDITVLRKIAESTEYSGTVYEAVWTRPNGVEVAVCLRYPSRSKDQLDVFLEEAKFYSSLDHENILRFHGVVIFGSYVNSLALVMEFAPLGNLQELMEGGGITSVRTVYSYACQIAAALDYLEDQSKPMEAVVPQFIYVFPNQKVKLGGFALSWSLKHDTKMHPFGFKIDYVAGKERYDFKHEDVVFVYGQILRNLYKSLPTAWSKSDYFHTKSPQYWQQYRFPDDMLDLMEKCASLEDARPTPKQLVNMLEQRRPEIVTTTTDYKAKRPIEMSFRKGETIIIMSRKPAKFMPRDLWFGQKEDGTFGFFSKNSTDKASQDEEDRVPAEIIARGPEAEHAYRKALLEGKVQVYRGRIMLIGQDRAGKTSLKKSLLGLPFNAEEPSTEGIEVDPSTFKVDVEQVSSWQRLRDVTKGGSQSERALAKLIAEELSRNMSTPDDAIPDIPDVEKQSDEDRKVSEALEEALKDLTVADQAPKEKTVTDGTTDNSKEEAAPGESARVSPKVLVKLPEEVAQLVAEFLQERHLLENQQHKETVLDVWDFAGQHLYYATHPVFFSSRAVYVLTHNLSKDLREGAKPCMRQGVDTIKLDNANNETNLENLVSWLVTVHGIQKPKGEGEMAVLKESKTPGSKSKYLRPPVVIVGTHADQPSMPVDEADALLTRAICGKTYDEHVLRPFFAVDNTRSSEDEGIQLLRKTIAQVLESEPYMGETLPAKWFNFEKAIKAQIEKNVFYLPLEDCRRIAQTECFITDASEVDTMLNFYHDLRVIVKHGGTVVLQSQWLINLFRSLITIRKFVVMDPTHSKHWINLEETGILHSSLVDHVFGEAVGSEGAQKDLLSMMEHYGLLAKFTSSMPASDGSSTECVEYFVPAQLTSSPTGLLKASPGDGDPCPLLIHFPDGFVPHGLFPQLVSRLICQFSEMGFSRRPNLFQNGARFWIGDKSSFDLYLLCGKRFIKVMLCALASLTSSDRDMAIQVRMLLEDSLEDLSREWDWLGRMRTELCVECRACAAGTKKCKAHGEMPCPDEDCVHVVPYLGEELLICDREFGGASRFDVPGIHRWFTDEPDQQSAKCILKTGKPVREELTLLARDIGSLWKRLGRALELEEPELEHLEADERHLYERCYGVLRRWTEIQASNATYERLGRALLHQTVMRKDLALKYCGMAQS